MVGKHGCGDRTCCVHFQMSMCEDDETDRSGKELASAEKRKLKRRKHGIIYLSTLPPHMNVTKIREIFGQFGEVGRVFLQPEEKEKDKKKRKWKPAKNFTEGWVEFHSKRIAKFVALQLNNTRIGERKKSKFYDYLWNIKYLPGFKWIHLNERLAYEQAVHRQRMRTEIAQAKREANYITLNMEKSEKLQKHKNRNKKDSVNLNAFINHYHQREDVNTVEGQTNVNENENKQGVKKQNRTDFLKNLFGNA